MLSYSPFKTLFNDPKIQRILNIYKGTISYVIFHIYNFLNEVLAMFGIPSLNPEVKMLVKTQACQKWQFRSTKKSSTWGRFK